MLSIHAIAEKLGVQDRFLLPFGPHAAKLNLDLLAGPAPQPPGRLILVTAINPTRHGEGKTVVSIGLAQAIERLGRKSVAALRQPSLGPLLGSKGGAAGGGRSRVVPTEAINLQFTGDFPAVTAAHNLIAAAIDSHIHHGNELGLDPSTLSWPRTLDMNDRALRQVQVGLGGRANGMPRQTGFVITAASEIMAILGLSRSRKDLRRRLNDILIGFDTKGHAVRAEQLGMTGALMVLLNNAILPNLAQTVEGTPAIIHTGPFANIAHGTSSVLAQSMGLRLAEFVVNEAGFGADLGAEKYFDIVLPASGIKPSAAVVVASVRALAEHGKDAGAATRAGAVEAGLCNLGRHLDNLARFGVPRIVAINHFPGDTPEETRVIADFCAARSVPSAEVSVFADGGAGGLDLARKVVAMASQADLDLVRPLYAPDLSLSEKITKIATEIYGADGVVFEPGAGARLEQFASMGFSHLPVCMAKTQSSFSDDPRKPGAPRGWTLKVTDAHLSAGAGFVVAVAGNMLLMPGLPKLPQALKMDVDDDGRIVGVG